MRIIILLATYNRSHLIGETLDSILEQTYNDWECIIIDDHSVDNTREAILNYEQKDRRFSYHLKNGKYKKGLSGTRNFGLDLAKERGAEFIQFFDDDDLMHPKKLELQLIPFLKNPGLNFTLCQYEKLVHEGNNWIVEQPRLQLEFSHLGDAILTGEMKMNSLGPLWRSDFIQNFRFDERLRYAEEWELYTRIGYKYPNNYEVVDEYLFQYRKHEDTLTLGEDKNYQRRKTSAVSRIIILEYLLEHKLLTKKSVLFLANTFLLYQYNPRLIERLKIYVQSHNGFSRKIMWYLNTGLIIGKLYRKTLRRMAHWV
ncbi:glycosyltransferase family 2 protein [Autumnicola musiva]|uniref:Glycosyltransferase family 2 protein n=1 Tax=Autumnicola musiva TaxID=3075589 RepID=A0ABU3D5I8_9FLAO|nr:glycosyltransferase family 2 protein [Zunongwangia sp. F117]MDT0676800.1 glycosyltransferase family 2 protein [Zunongwangia sp. F117]